MREHPGRRPAQGLTMIELAVVLAILLVLTLVLLPMSPWWCNAQIASCQGNLKQMATIFHLYADEAPGNRFPPKSPFAAAPDIAALYPDRMRDFEPLICPEDVDTDVIEERWYDSEGEPRIDVIRREGDASYTYLGFAIPNNAWIDPPESVRPLLEQAFENVDQDAEWTDHPNPNVGDVTLYRLRKGVARMLAEEGHMPEGDEYLAIMWDNVATVSKFENSDIIRLNHAPGGSNVLFLDGHVEFVEYRGNFPVTGELAEISYGVFGSEIPNAQP